MRLYFPNVCVRCKKPFVDGATVKLMGTGVVKVEKDTMLYTEDNGESASPVSVENKIIVAHMLCPKGETK